MSADRIEGARVVRETVSTSVTVGPLKVDQDSMSKAIATGVRDALVATVFLFALSAGIVSWCGEAIEARWPDALRQRDSTDGATRSGMRPHVDAATGCEYLSAPGGGITPRLDSDGRHMGCRGLER